jgi:hypothetical protein
MDFIFCFSRPGTGVTSPDNLQLGTLDMKDYALNQAGKFPSAHNDIVWAFDLGRTSLGDSPAPGGVNRERHEREMGAQDFGFYDRPHLCPLPRGEEFSNPVFRQTNDSLINPAAAISKDAANGKALSLGRGLGEGGRERHLPTLGGFNREPREPRERQNGAGSGGDDWRGHRRHGGRLDLSGPAAHLQAAREGDGTGGRIGYRPPFMKRPMNQKEIVNAEIETKLAALDQGLDSLYIKVFLPNIKPEKYYG